MQFFPASPFELASVYRRGQRCTWRSPVCQRVSCNVSERQNMNVLAGPQAKQDYAASGSNGLKSEFRSKSGRRVGLARLARLPRRCRARSDVLSARSVISSNRPNDRTRKCGLGQLVWTAWCSPEPLDLQRIVVKNAVRQCKQPNGGDASVTRKRLCTGLCIDIGDEEDCNYNVPVPLLSLC
jgi:hypothetical protein